MTAPAPYPEDTRAKGWRFEIDYEKIDQSSTWPLAAEIPMAQHALLMMWLIAWTQVPCGSLPNDEALIRAKCKIPPKLWPSFRDVLLRGWWLAEDGRLYHDTIVSRVLDMLDKRAANAKRTATRRARLADSGDSNDELTGVSRVTPGGPTREFDTKNQEPRTSSINTPQPPTGAGAGFLAFWSVWPSSKRKGGKADCERIWRRRRLEPIAETIVAHVQAMAHSEDWTKQGGAFVPMPSTYLNQARWDGADDGDAPGPDGEPPRRLVIPGAI